MTSRRTYPKQGQNCFLVTVRDYIVRLLKLWLHFREECTRLQEELEEKTKTLDLLITENKEVRSQLEEMTNRAQKAESENKMLIDRWMLQKMQDAERLNEVLEDFIFTHPLFLALI